MSEKAQYKIEINQDDRRFTIQICSTSTNLCSRDAGHLAGLVLKAASAFAGKLNHQSDRKAEFLAGLKEASASFGNGNVEFVEVSIDPSAKGGK